MMTKEEYKRNIVRMFDSIRSNNKGEKKCRGINCEDCPFDGKICNTGEKAFRVYEAIEIVEQWAEQHPVKTNSQKFEEVFGFKPYTKNCINGDEKVSCTNCQCFYDGECAVSKLFWDAEYNEKTKE